MDREETRGLLENKLSKLFLQGSSETVKAAGGANCKPCLLFVSEFLTNSTPWGLWKEFSRIMLFYGLEGRGLLLRNLLDVSSPSVCGIFRSVPSTLRMGGRGEKKRPESNLADTVVLEVRLLPEGQQHPAPFSSLPLPITVLKNAGRTAPKDAAHRWRRNVEKFSQK